MSDQPAILLTNPIHPDARALLSPHARLVLAPDTAPDTLKRLAAEAEGIIVRAMLPPDIFENVPRLRGVVRHGVGLDMIPVEAATARRIPVANVPGSNTTAVVEYALSAILTLRRRVARMDDLMRREGWAAARALADDTQEIEGSTCGIIGLGAIGSQLARKAQALGLRVLGATPHPDTLPEGVVAASLEDLLARADIVVLCCPLTEATRGMIDAQAIARMRPGALLINVARGPIVDAQALGDALRAGRLGGAALDVHAVQPLALDHPLRDCPNLVLTPHVAGITATSMRNMSMGAAEQMLAILRGERPRHLVNPAIHG
ncbi:D-3-phosphoglycerate dehydrogenase [plant metagenome]|uniref:D-3-phosphoglycerate dehydrogenase n=1 Tax=plant metagenome TaxID=1297885 RepID=A0A484PIW0_9ZZZZ